MRQIFALHPDAESDLRGITRYTRKQWGTAQTRAYMRAITAGLTAMASDQGTYHAMDDVHPGLRMTRCQHHVLFGMPQLNGPFLVVAVLHERMDLIQRLKSRLNV